MKTLPALLSAVLFVVPISLPAAAQSPGPAPGQAPAQPPAPLAETGAAEAPFHFALAKILLGEGNVGGALAELERATELAPGDPYIRLEYADLLARLAQSQRQAGARERQLARAAEQVDAARRAAPDNLDVLAATGDVYLALADYRPGAVEVALEALERVRSREPWNIQAMVSLGQIHRARGDAAEAAKVFDEVLSHTPENRILYSFAADAHEAAGHVDQAEEALRKILDIDPADVETRARLVESLSRRGEHAAAVEALQAVPEPAREEERLLALLARELYLDGKLEPALEAAGRALEGEMPERFRVYLGNLRASILADLGRQDEALSEYRRMLELDPDNPDLVRAVARQLLEEGRREEAVELLASFVRQHAGGAGEEGGTAAGDAQAIDVARLTLGLVYAEQEEWRQAEEMLEPLLDAGDEETRVRAAVHLAEVLHRSGRSDQALDLLERRQEESPALLGKRVDILLREGDVRRAEKLLVKSGKSGDLGAALELVGVFHGQELYRETLPVLENLAAEHGQAIEPQFLLGAAAERTGDTARAARAFERVLALEPNHAPTLNYLGYMWADRSQNLERAVEMIERAVALDPDNGAYVDSLGWAYYRMGNYVEAREKLERAVELVPEDPVIFDHLGDVYAALGDTRKAAELYRRALTMADGGDLDPVTVRRKLDELETD